MVFLFTSIVITLGSTAQFYTVQSLLHFFVLSGRYYKRNFHKSEKECSSCLRFHMLIPLGGSVLSPFYGWRFSIRLHLHWRNCFSMALFAEGAPRDSASHVSTCTNKCNSSQQAIHLYSFPPLTK